MFTAVNIAFGLTVAALAIIGLMVRRIVKAFQRLMLEPSVEQNRKRSRFYSQLEQRIRREANAEPTNPFPTLLLEMIARHHEEMADLTKEDSERLFDEALKGKGNASAKK